MKIFLEQPQEKKNSRIKCLKTILMHKSYLSFTDVYVLYIGS